MKHLSSGSGITEELKQRRIKELRPLASFLLPVCLSICTSIFLKVGENDDGLIGGKVIYYNHKQQRNRPKAGKDRLK